MSKRSLAWCLVLVGLSSLRAFGAEDQPGTIAADYENVTRGYLKDEVFGFKPQLGTFSYTDSLGQDTNRLGVGAVIEYNAADIVFGDRSFYVGPSTGFLFSHLGSATSNFLGTSPDVAVGDPGANALLVPINLKVGYVLGDSVRLSLRGGGNIFYRSIPESVQAGNSNWDFAPNIGGDLEIGFGPHMDLMFRPDYIFTPTNNLFTATFAIGLVLG